MSTSFPNSPRSRQAETAVKAARAAGRVLKYKFYEAREIQFKGYRDIVTDADFAADRTARAILQKAFPDYAVLSEEDKEKPQRAQYTWVMDPLDGTTNYARRIPIFSVSIALVERGRPLLGVVYDPMRDECFFAERRAGAYLNGTRIQASRIATLENAVIGYEVARQPDLRALGMKLFLHFASQTITARIGGSAALSLCYIGAGRLDAYFQPSLSAWDVAAGILIAREGGARVSHFDGTPATLKGGSYLAAAPKLYPEFFRQFQTKMASEA